MASCSYCGTFILFGGNTDETGRYCSDDCQQLGHLTELSKQIPEDLIERLVADTHQGNCPRCGGAGPVDVHNAHRVWSAFIMTSWSSNPAISCKACGVKRQLGNTLISGAFGWWGIPWGLIMTPVQICRNIGGMMGGPSKKEPSAELRRVVRVQAAAMAVQHSAEA